MGRFFKAAGRIQSLLLLVCLYLIFFTLMRVAFYFAFSSDELVTAVSEIPTAFWTGFRFDLRVAIFLALPAAILGCFPFLAWNRSESHRRFWIRLQTVISALAVLFYFLDFGYYAYLKSRLSSSVFQFLENPIISLEMLWQTYSLLGILLAFVVLTTGFYWLLRVFVFPQGVGLTPRIRSTKLQCARVTALVVFLIVGLYGSVAQYPLRWSDAFFSADPFVSAMAMNPIHYLVDTASNHDTAYSRKLVQKDYDTVANYLGVTDLDKENLNFHRPLKTSATFTTRPNVIYVIMESFAAYKTGTFGNPLKPSPEFDALAKRGILFRNFYTPTEGTARSVFCALTGLPDINAESTSSRNPLVVNQNTLVNAFKDYQKFYFIGGSATWGNIRGVYQNNVYGLQMFEEESYQKPRTDVWGLSDLDLFKEAARILKEKAKNGPFFAFVQSASYHRPYTIPKDHGDFKVLTPTEEEVKVGGFHSVDEYNSFRFSDYSLGAFLKLLHEDPAFANTVVVIHGDHGLPHYGAENVSEGRKFYGLNRFHVPLLFVSPLIKTPQVIDTMATEPDVMATLAGATGHEAINTALGQNLFALDPAKKRYAFSYVYYSNPLQIFLYDEKYIVSGHPQKIEGLYDYTSTTPDKNLKDENPQKFKEMSDLLNGVYETARWLLHHNPKLTQAN